MDYNQYWMLIIALSSPSTTRGWGGGGGVAGVGVARSLRCGGPISSRAPEVEVGGAAARPEGGR